MISSLELVLKIQHRLFDINVLWNEIVLTFREEMDNSVMESPREWISRLARSVATDRTMYVTSHNKDFRSREPLLMRW